VIQLLGALAPSLAIGGLALLFLPILPPEHALARRICAWLTIVLLIRYVVWRATATLPSLAFNLQCVVAYAYFVAETGAAFAGLLLLHVLSKTLDRRAEALAHPVATHPGGPPLIDVFIPTYNEKREIVLRTIIGALNQDYPCFRVWVLDDGKRGWLRELASAHGARYLTRSDNAHGKAGNMNAGLAHVMALPRPPDVIAVLDADFIATPQFLTRTAALLHDPDVAVVQTPQHFFNPDPIQLNLGAADVIPDEQRFFFDVILASKDAHGTAFSCGTSGLVRVSALQRVGGFPTESVTEDLLLSIKMTAIGMRTVYLNERLTVGLAPEGLHEYLTQRSRWCLGTMQIVRTAWGPFSRGSQSGERVPLLMRLHTLDTVLFWTFGPLARLFGFTMPIFYWWFGLYVMRTDTVALVEHLGPYWLSCVVFLGWVSRGTNLPLYVEAMSLLTMFASLRASAVGLFGSKNQKFKVTAKGASRDHVVVHWSLIRWFLLLAGLTVGGIAYRTAVGPVADTPPEVEAINFFWSLFNLATLLLASLMCIELPRFRSEERFPIVEPTMVTLNKRRFPGTLRDISLAGAGLDVSRGEPPEPGSSLLLEIRGVGAVRATVVRAEAATFHVRFDDESCRPALVRKIFSGDCVPSVTRLPLTSLFAVVMRRAFG
jgi:cellulose synthase (UDP-forming)